MHDGITYDSWPAASHAADAEDTRVSNANRRKNFMVCWVWFWGARTMFMATTRCMVSCRRDLDSWDLQLPRMHEGTTPWGCLPNS